MNQSLRQVIHDWKTEKNQRVKLQQAYFAAIILLALLSGITVLIYYQLSRIAIMVAAFLAVVYIVNAIMWVIVDTVITPKLPKAGHANPAKRK